MSLVCAVCHQARSIKKGMHVCSVLEETVPNITNAHLHPKWQQTPVWKLPQGGGVFFFFKSVQWTLLRKIKS